MSDPISVLPPQHVSPQPPKKRTGMKIALGVIAGLIVLGYMNDKDDTPAVAQPAVQATPTSSPAPTFEGTEVVPDDDAYWDGIAQVAWDQQDYASQAAVCVYWRQDPGAAMDAIAEGYGAGSASDIANMRASAGRLFNREC